MVRAALVVTVGCLLNAGTAFSAHPLITDDTGTQGKGRSQLEFVGQYDVARNGGAEERGYSVPTFPFLTYGLADATDILFGMPYTSERTEAAGTTTAVRGAADAIIQLKTRFYDIDGLSFAVKPGVSLPTGNASEGLGNGKTSYSLFFIATKSAEPWEVDFNAGYFRNEYRLPSDQETKRKDIWHVSLASVVKVMKDLAVAADTGAERNPDTASDTPPAYILGGLIYSLRENLDIDLGMKAGLNKAETAHSVLAGITWRF